VDANVQALFEPRPLRGEVVNIGAGSSYSLVDLVERLNTLLGTDLPPVFLPVREGDVLHSLADVSKAERLFGYRPRVDFAEGLRLTVESMH